MNSRNLTAAIRYLVAAIPIGRSFRCRGILTVDEGIANLNLDTLLESVSGFLPGARSPFRYSDASGVRVRWDYSSSSWWPGAGRFGTPRELGWWALPSVFQKRQPRALFVENKHLVPPYWAITVSMDTSNVSNMPLLEIFGKIA